VRVVKLPVIVSISTNTKPEAAEIEGRELDSVQKALSRSQPSPPAEHICEKPRLHKQRRHLHCFLRRKDDRFPTRKPPKLLGLQLGITRISRQLLIAGRIDPAQGRNLFCSELHRLHNRPVKPGNYRLRRKSYFITSLNYLPRDN